MNAAPKMLAIGHVAGLARRPLRRFRAGFPFRKRVLERLAVYSNIRCKLVALAAELRRLKECGPEDTAV
jgi:hypothetical protein